MGIAIRTYLKKIELSPIKVALGRDCPKVIGIDFPKRIKFIMLNKAPNTSPLAIALSLRNKKRTPATMAPVRAHVQIFF